MKIFSKLKSCKHWILILALSLLSSLITTVPIAIKFYHGSFVTVSENFHFFKIAVEIFAVCVVQYFFALGLLSLGVVGLVLWLICFLSSIVVAYFFVSFGKNIDAWVISDMLENINSLTFEYLSTKILILVLGLTAVFGFLARKIQLRKKSFTGKAFLTFHLSLVLAIVAVIFADDFVMKKVRRNYPPLSVSSSVTKYLKIRKESDVKIQKSLSLELIQKSKTTYEKKSDKPKVMVMIIGESLRNDYFYEMLPQFAPKLLQNKNISFFKDVSACETSTRKSVPCLLTDVDHGNWENFLNSVNMIDVFNKMRFSTYWIDNQSLYGYFDSTYSFLAKSSDVVIEEKYINADMRRYNNYDEVLLPYVKKALAEENPTKKDKFILIHLLGSHWHTELRYPKEYAIFSPHCSVDRGAEACSTEELKNSYKNSVVYSFKVLEDILDLFVNENAMVFFTPDHGVSLGEGGKIGNAADNKPYEQISVPLFVWQSDSFKKENQNLVTNFTKNSQKKITHQYMFHSILGCSGIESDLVKNNFNLCAPKATKSH
jgi:lipid A ethanolaminephosphotransferase